MEPDTTREDLLLTRVVDRCESVGDWAELEAMAVTDDAVWARLREQLAADALVRSAVAAELEVVERVELALAPRGRRAGIAWSPLGAVGWLAAVVFALLWLCAGDAGGDRGATGSSRSLQVQDGPPLRMPDELGVLVDAQPTADGRGLLVRALRTVVEEKLVDEVYQLSLDGGGGMRELPIGAHQPRAASDF